MNELNFKTKDTPIDFNVVFSSIKQSGIPDVGKATIRELVRVVNIIEKKSGKKFIRMEMGVPGLKPSEIGTNAEIEALKTGAAAVYPSIEGVPELKFEAARFVKLFMGIDVQPESCIPSVGTLQASFGSFLLLSKCVKGKDTILFIDPGFPVQKQQIKVLGQKFESFDVYDYRGDKLKNKIESYLKNGNIAAMIYSNPNNPAWFCFTEDELKVIGELANQYDAYVIEDLAYFAMDFRKDLSTPGVPPYQPTVANYTDNYVLLLSTSKAFSYAGQRTGLTIVSDKLYNKDFPNLQEQFGSTKFGFVMVYRVFYSLSAGTAHTPQFAIAAMLRAANEGKYNFVEELKEYGMKAHIMKKLFTDNGFKIVYDKDLEEPIADGFYFTITYKNMTGSELLERLLYYGISAISLAITGSSKEGLRACVSQVYRNQFEELEFRLKKFNEHHS